MPHPFVLTEAAQGMRCPQRETGADEETNMATRKGVGLRFCWILLAAALGGKNGIRVYQTGNYQEVARDPDYGDGSSWVDFDRDGRLVAVSYDGELRLYGKDFRRIVKRAAPGGKQPFCARFSPDGSRVAVGFVDSTYERCSVRPASVHL